MNSRRNLQQLQYLVHTIRLKYPHVLWAFEGSTVSLFSQLSSRFRSLGASPLSALDKNVLETAGRGRKVERWKLVDHLNDTQVL